MSKESGAEEKPNRVEVRCIGNVILGGSVNSETGEYVFYMNNVENDVEMSTPDKILGGPGAAIVFYESSQVDIVIDALVAVRDKMLSWSRSPDGEEGQIADALRDLAGHGSAADGEFAKSFIRANGKERSVSASRVVIDLTKVGFSIRSGMSHESKCHEVILSSPDMKQFVTIKANAPDQVLGIMHSLLDVAIEMDRAINYNLLNIMSGKVGLEQFLRGGPPVDVDEDLKPDHKPDED